MALPPPTPQDLDALGLKLKPNDYRALLISVSETGPRNLKMKIMLNESMYLKIVFAYVSEHCVSFGTMKILWRLLEGGSASTSLSKTGLEICNYNPNFVLSYKI